MDVPSTVETALSDRPVEGAVCLEAGAGVGNTTAGLLEAGARRVYAVTNDREHARTVHDRVGESSVGRGPDGATDRTAVVLADLRDVPLADDSVDVVTAHGLCNVLEPRELEPIAAELTRVAAPGCHLVVDDYEPLPEGAAVRDLFAVENAATHLAAGRSALTFYPASFLRHLLSGHGWSFDRRRTLLDPVPWTGNHVQAHADAAREAAATLPPTLGAPLTDEADRLSAEIRSASAGTMYSLAFRLAD